MVRVSLREFLATGRFGPLELGVSRELVEERLGPPEDWDARSPTHRAARIWKYGDVELHFARGGSSLQIIHADDFDVPSGGANVELDPWIVSGQLRRRDAEAELASAGIAFTTRPYVVEPDMDEVRTIGGISLVFAAEGDTPPGERRLVSMSSSEAGVTTLR